MKITAEFIEQQIQHGLIAVENAKENLAVAKGGLDVMQQLLKLAQQPEPANVVDAEATPAEVVEEPVTEN